MEFFSSVCQRCGKELTSEEFGGKLCFVCEFETDIEGADEFDDMNMWDYDDPEVWGE